MTKQLRATETPIKLLLAAATLSCSIQEASAENGSGWIDMQQSEMGLHISRLERDANLVLAEGVETEPLSASWNASELDPDEVDALWSPQPVSWGSWSESCELTQSPNGVVQFRLSGQATESMLLYGMSDTELAGHLPPVWINGSQVAFEDHFENLGIGAKFRSGTSINPAVSVSLPAGSTPFLVERGSGFALRLGTAMSATFHAGTTATFFVETRHPLQSSSDTLRAVAVSPDGRRIPAQVFRTFGGRWDVRLNVPLNAPYTRVPWEIEVHFESGHGCRSAKYAFGVSVPFARIEPRFKPELADELSIQFQISTLNVARLQLDAVVTRSGDSEKLAYFSQSAALVNESSLFTTRFNLPEDLEESSAEFTLHKVRLTDQQTGRVLQEIYGPYKFAVAPSEPR